MTENQTGHSLIRIGIAASFVSIGSLFLDNASFASMYLDGMMMGLGITSILNGAYMIKNSEGKNDAL